MRNAARILFYVLVAACCYPQLAVAQLAAGEPTTNFDLTDFITGQADVTDIAFLSDGRAVITRKTGQVLVVDRAGAIVKNPAAMFTVDSASEKGLLGVVRDAQDNLYFYASTGMQVTDKHRVYKATAAADGTITVDLQTPIVTGGLEGPANHDGGGMVIHKNQLYIGVGDTGANDTPPVNKYGSCLNKPNGKVLRVNLDGTIPADNPLNDLTAVTGCMVRNSGNFEMLPPDKRIYAWGFRNPWRILDRSADGPVVDRGRRRGDSGRDHGWRYRHAPRLALPRGDHGLQCRSRRTQRLHGHDAGTALHAPPGHLPAGRAGIGDGWCGSPRRLRLGRVRDQILLRRLRPGVGLDARPETGSFGGCPGFAQGLRHPRRQWAGLVPQRPGRRHVRGRPRTGLDQAHRPQDHPGHLQRLLPGHRRRRW